VSDWLVVGAGVAGSVVSARLAAAGATVTVVDAGPDTETGDDLFAALSVADRVRSTPLVRRVEGGPLVAYTSGVGPGGGSAINGSIMSMAGPFRHGHSLPSERVDGVARSTVDGRRVDVWGAYHGPSTELVDNLVLSTSVESLLVDSGRCVGARTESGDELVADRVVVCAGAIMTPTLLLRSAIGGAAVGFGLQDHPAVALVHERRSSLGSAGPSVATLERRGPLQIMHLRRLGVESDSSSADELGATVVMLMRPESRGSVRLDESGSPAVWFGIGSVDADVQRLSDGVSEILGEGFDGDVIDAPRQDTVEDWVRERLATAVPVVTHVASGCAMGLVVDRLGRPSGVENLFVCDASVFPAVPSINPMLPTIQLAETLVDRWIALGLV
jgi:choline dehydrogenase-like flavoprotein